METREEVQKDLVKRKIDLCGGICCLAGMFCFNLKTSFLCKCKND